MSWAGEIACRSESRRIGETGERPEFGIQSTNSSKLPQKGTQFLLVNLYSFVILGLCSSYLSYSLFWFLVLLSIFQFLPYCPDFWYLLCFFSGNQKSGSKSSRLLKVISQMKVSSKKKKNKAEHPGYQMQLEQRKNVHIEEKIPLQTSISFITSYYSTIKYSWSTNCVFLCISSQLAQAIILVLLQ